jgi:hypothetical protein
MSAERYMYALTGWTVEKRAKGWYFVPWANRLRRDKQGERRASIWMRNCRRMHDGRRA